MNWKTMLGALGICTIIGGWMVTASVTQDNKTELKETKKDVQELREIVIEQRALNREQQDISAKQTTFNEMLLEYIRNRRGE
jgi:uncharacterized protein YlxW (UPF0749 family)